MRASRNPLDAHRNHPHFEPQRRRATSTAHGPPNAHVRQARHEAQSGARSLINQSARSLHANPIHQKRHLTPDPTVIHLRRQTRRHLMHSLIQVQIRNPGILSPRHQHVNHLRRNRPAHHAQRPIR